MIEELDYDYRSHNTAEGDKNLAVRFYMEAIPDDDKSVQEGRPIFKDVEFIEIRVRGDRNNVVQRPVFAEDKKRWVSAYKAFKAGEDEVTTGTPLREWPSLPKSLLLELNHMGFRTVEDVSNASDGVCAKMAGLQHLKQRAKSWLDAAKGGAPLEQLHATVAAQANELETVKRQLQDAQAELKVLGAQATKKI